MVVVAAIVLIVGALDFYDSLGTPSNTVYCGVFQYLEFTAQSVVGQSTRNVTETMTTAISFTTSTSITGHVGQTYSNMTSTTNASGQVGGVETICKYISNTSFSSSK